MNSINSLLEAVKLSLANEFSSVDFFLEYENRGLYKKLDKPTAVIALKKLEVEPHSLYDFIAQSKDGAIFGKSAKAEIKLSIFSDAREKAEAQRKTAFQIADSLLFGVQDVSALSVSETLFQKNEEVFSTEINFTIETLLTKDFNEERVDGFEIKTKIN